MSSDKKIAAVACEKFVDIYSISNGSRLTFERSFTHVKSAAIVQLSTDNQVAFVGNDDKILFINMTTGEKLGSIPYSMNLFAISHNSKALIKLSRPDENDTYIVQAVDITNLSSPGHPIRLCAKSKAFAVSGDILFTGYGLDLSVYNIFDIRSPVIISKMSIPYKNSEIIAIALSPDNTTAAIIIHRSIM